MNVKDLRIPGKCFTLVTFLLILVIQKISFFGKVCKFVWCLILKGGVVYLSAQKRFRSELLLSFKMWKKLT